MFCCQGNSGACNGGTTHTLFNKQCLLDRYLLLFQKARESEMCVCVDVNDSLQNMVIIMWLYPLPKANRLVIKLKSSLQLLLLLTCFSFLINVNFRFALIDFSSSFFFYFSFFESILLYFLFFYFFFGLEMKFCKPENGPLVMCLRKLNE